MDIGEEDIGNRRKMIPTPRLHSSIEMKNYGFEMFPWRNCNSRTLC